MVIIILLAVKEFIKLYGRRVNIDETELLIKNVILDCACTGQDDQNDNIYLIENRLDER